jgi:hypothetical protein
VARNGSISTSFGFAIPLAILAWGRRRDPAEPSTSLLDTLFGKRPCVVAKLKHEGAARKESKARCKRNQGMIVLYGGDEA